MDPINVGRGAMYTRMQRYTLQTHSVPDEEPPTSTGGGDRQQVNASSKINGAATYTRMQRYTLQTHSLQDTEPMPSTSGEDRRQATEAGEEQNMDAGGRRKRTSETQSDEPVADPKKKKKAPTSSTAAQGTTRSNEASPDELYLTATSEDVNPWLGQREQERAAPPPADPSGWRRPHAESAGAAAPAEHVRRVVRHTATAYGARSSALDLALADCFDSLSSLDPNALYQVEFVPPVPARLTFTRVEAPPLPPPPPLFPYGVPGGSRRTYYESRRPEASAPEQPAVPAEEVLPDARWPANATDNPSTTRRATYGMERWPHGPNHCVPLPWIQGQLPPVIRHVKDAETNTMTSQESQTDIEENSDSNTGNNNGKCCSLITANRVLLHHYTPQNRGRTTVLDVEHIPHSQRGPSNYSTPNPAGNSRISAPTSDVRPPGQVRPPEAGSANRKNSELDTQQTPNMPRRDRSGERNSTGAETSQTASYSALNNLEATFPSYANTTIQQE